MDESAGRLLLPCLPEDVSWQCLVRLPRLHRAIASSVSRAWAIACKSESLIASLRRSLNLPPEYSVFIAVFDSRFDGDDYVRANERNTKWLLVDPVSLKAKLLPNPLSAISNPVEMNLTSAAVNNRLFLPQVINQTEGRGGGGGGFSSYDTGTGRWKSVQLPPWEKPRRKFCCAGTKDFVYLCGGVIDFSGEASRSAFRYDARNDVWEKLPDMIMPRINCAGVSVDDKFYAVGGYFHSPAGFPEIHVSAERFDPQTGQWRLLPNFCANGLRYAEDSATTSSNFAVVEKRRLFAVQAESNEVMELDGEKEEWRHSGFIGGVCHEMRDCGTNYRIVGVGCELWAIRFTAGKSIRIYSCKPGESSEGLTWRQIELPGILEGFDHVLTGAILEV